MADSKTIKIKFELDQQSFQQVKTAIDSLGTSLQKMNANMPGVNFGGAAPSKEKTIQDGNKKGGGGGGGSQATMGKVILDNAAAFKKFAQEGKDASKIMTEALTRDIANQERSLDSLKSKLHNLNDEFKLATAKQKEFLEAGNKQGAGAMEQHIENLEKQLAQTSGDTLQGAKGLAGSKDALTGAMGGAGGLKQEIGSAISGALGGNMAGIAGLMSKFALPLAVLAAGKQMYHEVREGGGGLVDTLFSDGKTETAGQGGMTMRAEARRGKLVNGKIAALRNGDMSDLLLEQYISRDTAKAGYLAQQTDGFSKAGGYVEGAQEAAGRLPLGAGALLKMVGIAKDSPEAQTMFEGLNPQEVDAKMMELRERAKKQGSESAGFQDILRAQSHFQNTFGQRLQGAQMFGMSTDGSIGKDGKVHGKFSDVQDWAAERGIDSSQVFGNMAGMRQAGGNAFGGTFGFMETSAQLGGYSGFGAMGTKANRGARNAAEAQRLALGALGGGIETGAGIGLGDQIFGYNAKGTTSGEGLLAAIQGGTDWHSMTAGQQFNRVEALGGGIKIGDAVAGGTLDNSMRGSGVLSAKRILGEGSSSYAQDYLAGGMDLKQMQDIGYGHMENGKRVYGKATDAMNTFGISSEAVRRQFESQNKSFFGGVSGDSGKMGTAVRAFLGSGQSFADFSAKNKDMAGALNTAVSMRTGAGGEEAAAYADILRGTGTSKGISTGGIGAGKPKDDSPEGKELKRRADQTKKDEGLLKENEKMLMGAMDSAQKMIQTYKDWGTNMELTIDDVIKALQKLPEFINRGDAPGTAKVTAPSSKPRGANNETYRGGGGKLQ